MDKQFTISSALKDVIGRDLITSDYVAIFELVKNAFDAHARNVNIIFEENTIVICDDGKGMSEEDIIAKWLFVAYSAKRTGEEDDSIPNDYRDAISRRRGYAGNKGIGRFSCDRLGEKLALYSRALGRDEVECLVVNWIDFEKDSKTKFDTINVDLSQVSEFPSLFSEVPQLTHGTVLVISDIRDNWDKEKVRRLRSYLGKLIDPFQSTSDLTIFTHVMHEKWPDVEGKVGNQIIDLLDEKTAKIFVKISNGKIHTTLHDRTVLIYEIEEDSPYSELKNSEVHANLYYLNRSAKQTFTIRMGVQPVQFGNIFLFVNGFRIYPIGEPADDTFEILRRKQQGQSRYLGPRDILGKIEVSAPPLVYREASSRDAGLTDTPAKVQLYEAIMKHVFLRLERYVVSVNWVDSLDHQRDDASGLRSDSARARIIRVIKAMVGTKKVRLLDYDRELVDIVNERSIEFEESMEGLALVAEKTGDKALLARIGRSRERYEELKRAEAEAKKRAEEEARARKIAEKRAVAAEQEAKKTGILLERVEKQAQLLLNAQSQGTDELQLLHHQVIIYSSEVQALAKRSMRRIASGKPPIDSIRSDLEQIAFQNSRILTVTRMATQANFRLTADSIEADILQYMKEYVDNVVTMYSGVANASFESNDLDLQCEFKPIDVSIVIDNLVSNSQKANAHKIIFSCRRAPTGNAVEIFVSDDGRGINSKLVDILKIFERGYSGSKRGSGLGLYHARQVIEDMGGSIALDQNRSKPAAEFIIRLPRKKKKR